MSWIADVHNCDLPPTEGHAAGSVWACDEPGCGRYWKAVGGLISGGTLAWRETTAPEIKRGRATLRGYLEEHRVEAVLIPVAFAAVIAVTVMALLSRV